MKKGFLRSIYVLLLVLLLATSFAIPPSAGALSSGVPPEDYVEGQIVIMTQPGVSKQATAASLGAYGAAIEQTVSESMGIYVVKLPGGYSVDQAVNSFQANSVVAVVERNWVYKLVDDFDFTKEELPGPDLKDPGEFVPDEVKAAIGTMDSVNFVPNDPLRPYQWALQKINAYNAWNVAAGNTSQVIAIVDTGVDYNHPEFRNYAGGYRFLFPAIDTIDIANAGWDRNGHGTHVTGIAAATGQNATGIAGTTWVTRILNVRALNAAGTGSTGSIYGGILEAAGRGIRVLNGSFGRSAAGGASAIEQAVLTYVASQGILMVFAAGNDNGAVGYPARYVATIPNIMSVSATGPFDEKASYSNFGLGFISVAAPGGNGTTPNRILSTTPRYAVTLTTSGATTNNYGYLQGTSMAAPYVTGAAAVVWGRTPSLTAAQVKDRLQTTADDLGGAGYDAIYGFGRINLGNAVGVAPTRFTGRITNSNTGAGIPNAVVYLYPSYIYTYTDANGFYNLEVSAGTYYVIAQATGYLTNFILTSIATGQVRTVNLALTPIGVATVTGTIRNAVDGTVIAGATVQLYRSTGALVATTASNSLGVYTFSNVPTGSSLVYYVVVSRAGFQNNYAGPLTFPGAGTYTQNVALSPLLPAGQSRLILSWQATPRDLDLHVWLPSAFPYHVKFNTRGSATAFPFTQLDRDDTNGFGPETTTVYRAQGTASTGWYLAAVYNFSNEANLAGSGAQFRLLRAGSSFPIAAYTVPATGAGRWWRALWFNPGTGQFVTLNSISTTPGALYDPNPSDAEDTVKKESED